MKPVVVLTTFWNANAIINYGLLSYQINLITYGINLDGSNFTVNSIALKNPPLNKLPHLKGISRLNFFCPSWDILHRYHNDNDWDAYTKIYYDILKNNKEDIRGWMGNLKEDHVYFLCCWENTLKEAHCHRQLVYDALLASERATQLMTPVYKHGDKL